MFYSWASLTWHMSARHLFCSLWLFAWNIWGWRLRPKTENARPEIKRRNAANSMGKNDEVSIHGRTFSLTGTTEPQVVSTWFILESPLVLFMHSQWRGGQSLERQTEVTEMAIVLMNSLNESQWGTTVTHRESVSGPRVWKDAWG